MEIFPPQVKQIWDDWGIRFMVIGSLLLQVILIFIGNRRKVVASTWIRFILWFSYLSADWFATVALGALSNKLGDDDKTTEQERIKNQLLAFWAPFLLLHLGGPDTITAYALEDNELWIRHLLGLVVQAVVAVYIFLISWRGGQISKTNIPMFIAGLVKYGERTWVLRSASKEHFRNAMLNPPDPGPNYAKFMDEYSLKRAEGFHIKIGLVNEGPTADDEFGNVAKDIHEPQKLMRDSYRLFTSFRRLFADLILSFQDRDKSRSFFRRKTWDDAFKVIELELGFIYDVLFTKSALVFSRVGAILRSLSFSTTVLALVLFATAENHRYDEIDVIITYLLLVIAILLEIYAVFLLVTSDWTILWTMKDDIDDYDDQSCGFLWSSRPLNKHRWSNKMAQYNLISFSLKDKPIMLSRIYRIFCIDDWMEKRRYKYCKEVPTELKVLIFQQLERKSYEATDDLEVRRNLCNNRGNDILLKNKCLNSFEWSTTKVEFDQSILLWHIATDLCFYSDFGDVPSDPSDAEGSLLTQPHTGDPNYEIGKMGKMLSDYLLYLLVLRPSMLPAGIGQIRFIDTCSEASEFFQERRGFIDGKQLACKRLIDVNTDIPPIQVKGDRSKSVLFDACRLAKLLEEVLKEKKWEIIRLVWIEILCYAANQCKAISHAQQLGRGGELLTHVWLLMAHLGITEQFQISQGHMRAKLEVQ